MEKLAFAASAETTSKIINSHIATTSPDSIIKILEKAEITINTDYECIGVDDWAFKKGNKYGTLICDLKTHKPIAILENRDYKALSDWLRDKTDIKYCSRDRSKIYAAAINDTLPKALHIADRFHLVHNIGEVIVDFLKRQYTNGIKLNISNTNGDEKDISNYWTRLEKEKEERYNKKWQLIMQVQEMYKSIPNISHICRCFSLDRKTVSNYIEIKEPPDPQSWKRSSILDEYKPIVIELVKKGNNKQYILEAIKKEGYRGSERTLRNFIKDLKDEKYNIYLLENPENKAHKIQRKKMMTLIFCLPEKLSDKQKEQLEKILEDKTLNKLYRLVQSFRIIVKERRILELEAWIDSALSSEIKELSIFAQGLQSDIECIKNALIYPYSNGILEGNVNRLKMIKRMMYGRAGYRLLSKRILYSFN